MHRRRGAQRAPARGERGARVDAGGHIIVGFNDTHASCAALDWAADAARRLTAALTVVWVLPATTAWELAALQVDPDRRRQQMVQRLREICADRLGRRGIDYQARVIEGSPTTVLRRSANKPGALLLVIGASRRGAIGDLVMGSVAHDLAHSSPLPVVVVPPEWAPRSPTAGPRVADAAESMLAAR